MNNYEVDVSIIMVSYNTSKLTTKAIGSVYNWSQGFSFEIIIVDNSSKDNTIVQIEEQFPKVKIIKNHRNIGFGRANNLGFEMARGKYNFLLNTDTYLLNNAIKYLFDFMENPLNKSVAIVGGKLYFADGRLNVFAGNFPSYELFVKGSFLKYFYGKHFYLGKKRRVMPNSDVESFEVDYVSGADFFIRNEVIKKVGGFDQRFFLYGEEVELTHRIKFGILKGESFINSKAKIVHLSQGSNPNKANSFKFKYQQVKSTALYYKITKGVLASYLYYLISLKRITFNKLFK